MSQLPSVAKRVREVHMAASSPLEALRGLTRRNLHRFLEQDPRVREWLAGGALKSTKQAAEYLDVERQRLWRWENAGKIKAAVRTDATPLYFTADLDKLRDEVARERRGGAGTRGETAAA